MTVRAEEGTMSHVMIDRVVSAGQSAVLTAVGDDCSSTGPGAEFRAKTWVTDQR